MFFSRIFSFAVLSLSIISAAATPAIPIKPRDNASALAVVNTLGSTSNGILSQINSLVASKAATRANVSPLVANLVGALGTASSSLQGLSSRDISAVSAADVANAAGPVFTNIANVLSQPALASLVDTGPVGTAIGKVVVALDVLVVGVQVLLAGVLVDVAIILGGGLLGLLGL